MPRQPLSSQVRSTFPFRRAAKPPNPREKPGLGGEQARRLHHFIEVGEYGLPLKEITGMPAQHAVAITDQHAGDILAGPPYENGRPGARALRFCGGGDLPPGEVISRGVGEGVPRNGQRVDHVGP